MSKVTKQTDPDFWDDVPDLTVNNVRLSQLRAQDRSDWLERIPLSPRQFHDLFTDGYERRAKIDVNVAPYRQFEIHIVWDNNRNYFSRIVYDSGARPLIRHSTISIPEEDRGQGTGKNFIRNFMEFHHALGGDKFLFSAGRDNGGYSWASMGGYLDKQPSYRSSLTDASVRVFGRFDVVRSYLPKEIHAPLKNLLALKNKDDLANLVRDYRHVYIPDHLKPDMQDVSDHILSRRLIKYLTAMEDGAGHAHKAAYEEVRHIGRAFQWAAQQGQKGLSLPRYLLTCVEWPGVVDYQDAAQMKRVGDYLGGWKTIRPVNDRPEQSRERLPALING